MTAPEAGASPRVTAIVAAYNEERHIAECVQSLLRQTYTPLEILVVDDGSTDRTAAIAGASPRVQVLRRPHEGKARAINAAAREASGEIILFLDGDLRFDAGYVRSLVAPILSGEAVGASHASEYVANPDNVWSRCLQARYRLPADRRLDLTPAQIAEGTIIFRAIRRDLFLGVGGFDDTGYLDDHTLYPKLGRRGRFVEAAVCYHYNPDRLREVFAMGLWAGKSVHHLRGARGAFPYAPPMALLHAAREAVRLRAPAMAIFVTAYECGVFWGVVKRAAGRDRTAGA